MSEFHLLNKMDKLHHQPWVCFVYIDGCFTQGLLITVFDGQLYGVSARCFALAFMSSSNWSVVKMNPAQLTEVNSSGFKGHRLCLHKNTEGKSMFVYTSLQFFSRQITKPAFSWKVYQHSQSLCSSRGFQKKNCNVRSKPVNSPRNDDASLCLDMWDIYLFLQFIVKILKLQPRP